MWTLIRLLLEEQSDLGLHCLQKLPLKSQEDDKQTTIVVISRLRVKALPVSKPNRWDLVQSNVDDSNIFGIMRICAKHG